MKNTGWGYMHYTMSAWETSSDLKEFARTGAHADAMKRSVALAREIRILTYETNRVPSWREAKALIKEKGRIISF